MRFPFMTRLLFCLLAFLSFSAVAQKAGADTSEGARLSRVMLVQSDTCSKDCPRWIYVTGPISTMTQLQVRDIVFDIGYVSPPVVFNSDGGSADAAMAIGRMLRARHIPALAGKMAFSGCDPSRDPDCRSHERPGDAYRGHVTDSDALCIGACVMAFLGGEERAAAPGKIGLPVITDSSYGSQPGSVNSLADKNGNATVFAYMASMGVQGKVFDRLYAGTANSLQRDELRALGIVTSGKTPADVLSSLVCKPIGKLYKSCETNDAEQAATATPAPKKNPTAILMRNSDKACEPNCPEFIYVGRFISDDTAGEIEAISTRMKGKALPVVFNAPFGNAVSAMAVGRTMRKLKLTALAMEVTFDSCSPFILTSCLPEAKSGAYLASTLQPTAYCNGACMIGFAGGVTRAAVAKAFTLVSPMDGSLGQQVADDNQRYLKEIPDYFISMGLTPSIRAKLEQIGKGTTLPLDQPTAKLFKLVNSKADPIKLLSPAACRSKASAAWCVKTEGVVPPNRPELVTTSKPGKPTKPAAQPTPSYMQPMRAVLVRSNERDCEPNCPEWIQLDGQITGQSPAVVKKALAQAGKLRLPVLIRSPGGDVRAALAIGRMIRDRKLDVAVGWTRYEGCQPEDKACVLPKTQKGVYRGTALSWQAFCESACPLVMAAGQRRLSGYYASVGVHQILTTWHQERIFYRVNYRIVNGKKKEVSRTIVSRKPTKTYTTTGLYKGLRKDLTVYLTGMGVSTDIFTDMDLAPPSSIHELPLKRQQDLKLATGWENLDEVTAKKICGAPQPAENCVALPQ